MAERQLYRSRNALLGGVCAGIAERLDADAIVVRIFVVLLACVTFGLGVLAYIALWVNLPLEPEGPEPFEITPEFAESSAYGIVQYPDGTAGQRGGSSAGGQSDGLPVIVRVALAAGLMVLFLVVAMNISPLVPGTNWWQFWPIGFMIVGLCLIVMPFKGDYDMLWHGSGIVLTSLFAVLLPVTLGITPIGELIPAVVTFWPLLVIALIMLVYGVMAHDKRFVIASSIIVAALCLMALYQFALPSAPEAMMNYADGRRGFVRL